MSETHIIDDMMRLAKASEILSGDVLTLRQIVSQRDARIAELEAETERLTWEHEARFCELKTCRDLLRSVLRQQGVMNQDQWTAIEVEAGKEAGE